MDLTKDGTVNTTRFGRSTYKVKKNPLVNNKGHAREIFLLQQRVKPPAGAEAETVLPTMRIQNIGLMATLGKKLSNLIRKVNHI